MKLRIIPGFADVNLAVPMVYLFIYLFLRKMSYSHHCMLRRKLEAHVGKKVGEGQKQYRIHTVLYYKHD